MTNQISVESLSITSYKNIPVVTTDLLAQLYDTEVINIQVNHTRNRDRFIEGKHFFKLEGIELKQFKDRLTDSKLVGKRAKSVILWTERGAARHAKMLETDQAWEVFEKLEDHYFNQKESSQNNNVFSGYRNCRVLYTFDDLGIIVKAEIAEPDEFLTSGKNFAELMKRQGYYLVRVEDFSKVVLPH